MADPDPLIALPVTPPPAGESCSLCRYWVGPQECHLYPPDSPAGWVTTKPTDWCGMFEASASQVMPPQTAQASRPARRYHGGGVIKD